MLRLDTKKLFMMQEQLDRHIESEHGLRNEDLTNEKLLALEVEVGELANETRCFKFWSIKPPSEKAVILEEYVDGLHFILSLGLTFGYRPTEKELSEQREGLVAEFLAAFDCITAFRRQSNADRYSELFFTYMALGEQLGFVEEDIHSAYEKKNQVNHTRQESGY